MKSFFADLVKRFSSRKLLLVVGGIIGVSLFPDLTEPIIILVGLFVGAEGGADIVRAWASSRIETTKIEKDITLINAGEIPAGSVTPTSEKKDPIVPGRSMIQ